MTRNITRRTFLKRSLITTSTVLGVSVGGAAYAHKIEPALLEITEIPIKSSKLPKEFHNKTIIQFSDTHLGFQYSLEQFENLVKKINSFKPDIICFTGDLIDDPSTFKEVNKTIKLLSKLTARLGKFAIYGNHDHGGYGTDLYEEIINDSGFELLNNSSTRISLKEEYFTLIGVDDAMLGQPDLEKATRNLSENSLNILLSHAPDLAKDAVLYDIDYQISGHSHGGQVRLPLIGPLVRPPYAKQYVQGLYKLGEEEKLTLYVNRGLGTTRLPCRLLAKPELTIYTLKSS